MSNKDEIKAYMEAKMTHIKIYNECMNLADGLDVEKFAELVRQDERELCAMVADIALLGADRSLSEMVVKAIRARGEK